MAEMAANGDGFADQVPLSDLWSNVEQIFGTKQYEKLKFPYHHQEEKNYLGLRSKKLTSRIIAYCDLLKQLTNDKALQTDLNSLNDDLLKLRVRYEIVGNVLKTIFMLHGKSKRIFMSKFKTLAVKIFTCPKSNKKVKVVVLQHLGNGVQQGIDDLRPPLPGLSIRRTRRTPARTEKDAIFDALRNQRTPERTQPNRQIRRDGIENITIPLFDTFLNRPFPEEQVQPIDQIQSDVPALDTNLSRQIPDEGVQPAPQIQSIGTEDIPVPAFDAQLNRLIPEEENQPTSRIQRGGIERVSIPSVEIPQYHPPPYAEQLRIRWPRPRSPPQPIATGSQVDDQFLYQLEANLQYLREAGLSFQGFVVHNLKELNTIVNEQLELLITGRLVPIPRPEIPEVLDLSSVVPMTQPARRVPENVAAEPAERRNGVPEVPIPRPEIPDVLDLSSVVPMTQPARRVPENVAAEPAERRNGVPEERTRQTIADDLIHNEVFQQEFPSAFVRAVGPPGSVMEIPLADVPFSLEQRVPEQLQSQPARQIGDLLAELETEEPEKVKTTPRKRNKFTFNNNIVIARKLEKTVKPPTFVPHYMRLRNDMNKLRHPFNKLIPFDEFEFHQEVFRMSRYSNIAYGELATRPNNDSDMLFEMSRRDDENDGYSRENEFEARIANLEASMRVPLHEIIRQTSSFSLEPIPRENIPTIEGIRVPDVQVQPPNEDIQIPVQPPTENTRASAQPQTDNISSNIPVPESRVSTRPSQGMDQPPGTIPIEDFLQINHQPVDGRTSLIPVPTDVALIAPRVSLNLPRLDDNLLNIPDIDVPATSRPSIHPEIHNVGAEANVAEMIHRERIIEVEGIPPKRRRTTSPQGTVGVVQIPGQVEPQQIEQIPLLSRTDLTLIEGQQTVPPTDITEIVPPAAITLIDQPNQENILRNRRERITREVIEFKLESLYEQSKDPVCLITLCALTAEHTNRQKRRIIAKVFGIILDLVHFGKVQVFQEQGSWSPEDVLIFWIEPEPEGSESGGYSEAPEPEDSEPGGYFEAPEPEDSESGGYFEAPEPEDSESDGYSEAIALLF